MLLIPAPDLPFTFPNLASTLGDLLMRNYDRSNFHFFHYDWSRRYRGHNATLCET